MMESKTYKVRFDDIEIHVSEETYNKIEGNRKAEIMEETFLYSCTFNVDDRPTVKAPRFYTYKSDRELEIGKIYLVESSRGIGVVKAVERVPSYEGTVELKNIIGECVMFETESTGE